MQENPVRKQEQAEDQEGQRSQDDHDEDVGAIEELFPTKLICGSTER